MCVLAAEADGHISAGLPFAHIEDFRGPRRVALAFADNIEPLPASSWEDFEAWIAADAFPWSVRTLCAPTGRATSSRVAAQHHSIALPASFDEAAAGFHYKHVQNLKQAQKAGLTVRKIDSSEGIDIFYALHSLVRKQKHGLVPQPRAFFDAIFERFFPHDGFVLIAEHEGRVVSAMFFLACGRTLYYKFSASALDALLVRPNHFLLTKAIELAIELGFATIDLGISDTEGLIRFKERIGGVARDVHAAAYNPREKTAGVAAVEKAFGDLTAVLTDERAPIEAAQRGGDILYRFFT